MPLPISDTLERGPVKFTPDSALVHDLHPSPNFGERRRGMRPHLLVLHYTGLPSVERSIAVLSDPNPKGRVSCHYVVGDDGRTTQMVAEAARAWHAGVSSWHGESDINSASIGIEIQNPGHSGGYPDFGKAQMRAVRDLCLDIVGRNRIPPHGVLAHSDVAPGRKIDPGEKFDWAWLARHGVGHWVRPEPATTGPALDIGDSGPEVAEVQARLTDYGYLCPATGEYDDSTRNVVDAFQRHFRPKLVDGCFDRSCALTLERLIAALPNLGAGA